MDQEEETVWLSDFPPLVLSHTIPRWTAVAACVLSFGRCRLATWGASCYNLERSERPPDHGKGPVSDRAARRCVISPDIEG